MKVSYFPRVVISVMGVVNPLMREIAKMGYLWTHPVELKDDRLATLLGPDFGTPFDDAVAASVSKFFPEMKAAA
jgi:hypothetical protein